MMLLLAYKYNFDNIIDKMQEYLHIIHRKSSPLIEVAAF